MNALAMILMMAVMALVGGMGLHRHACRPDSPDAKLDGARTGSGLTNAVQQASRQP